MNFLASPEMNKQVLPTEERVTELERPNEEMTRNDLMTSLFKFQTQMGGHLQNNMSSSSSPEVHQANEPAPGFVRDTSTRHNSLDFQLPSQRKRVSSLDLQSQADLKKMIPSQDRESPAMEPPYAEKPSSSFSSRDETTANLKSFQTKMAGKIYKDKPKKTTLSSLEHQDEPQQESQATAPELKVMSFLASPEVTKQVLPAKKQATELERQNEEMTRNDLTASLLQFQTHMGGHLQKNKPPPSSPEVQEANERSSRVVRDKSTRHNSVDFIKSPLRPKRGSLDLKPALKSKFASLDLKPALKTPKYSTMPGQQQQQQQQGEPDEDGLSERHSDEDESFRKWFESKMDAREGANASGRYMLEEDDIGEDEIVEASFPENKSEDDPESNFEDDPLPAIGLGQQETTAATATDSVKEAAPPENHKPGVKESREETLLAFPSKDRGAQIEHQNEHLSRDQIKSSFLQFQSQIKHLEAKEPQASAELSPSNDSVKEESLHRWTQERVSQLEPQNKQISRNELTASLLQFQSKIGKIQPSPPRKKENVGQDNPNEASNKPNLATNECQSQVQTQMQYLERWTEAFQDRVMLLEERETTPRNEMVSNLKQFQLDIQGRIDQRPSKKSVEKSSTNAPVEKCTKQSTKVREVTKLKAENNDGMEVTDHDYLIKIHEKNEGPRFQKSREQRATRRALENHAHVEREANERPRRDVTASLLQFQSQIEDLTRSSMPL
jgi:hypothetical protein